MYSLSLGGSSSLSLISSCGWLAGGGVSGDPLKVAAEVLRNEGPSAFFSGWQAQYLRLGPQTVITFMLLEQLRFLIGMDTF